MSYDSIPANLFKIAIVTSENAGEKVYTLIEGLKSITPKPSTKSADGTTLDNAGWTRNVPVSKGLSYDLAGLAQRDPETGAKAPGQAAVEALGALRGAECVGEFALIDPDSAKCLTFRANVADVVSHGGGPDDLSTWTAALELIAPPAVATKASLGL